MLDLWLFLWYSVCYQPWEVAKMAKITVKELYYGERYGVMGEVFKAMLVALDKTVDEQTRLELEIVRQTLIVAEKMK